MIKEQEEKFERLQSFVQSACWVWIGLGVLALFPAVFVDGTIRLLLIGLAAMVVISGFMLLNVLKIPRQ